MWSRLRCNINVSFKTWGHSTYHQAQLTSLESCSKRENSFAKIGSIAKGESGSWGVSIGGDLLPLRGAFWKVGKRIDCQCARSLFHIKGPVIISIKLTFLRRRRCARLIMWLDARSGLTGRLATFPWLELEILSWERKSLWPIQDNAVA